MGFMSTFAQNGGFVKQNVPELSIGRTDIKGALLPDGSFIVFGGHIPGFQRSNTAERWKEGDTAWTVFTMTDYRDYSAIVRIDSNHIFLAGGMASGGGVGQIASTEIYDATNNTFTPKANMQVARTWFRGAKLTNNKMLFVGNWYNDAFNAEIYNPVNDSFELTQYVVNPRACAYVIPRSNNGAVIMGGLGTTGGDIESIEIFDYATKSFSLYRNHLLVNDSGWIYNTMFPSGTYFSEDHSLNGKFYFSAYKPLTPSGYQYMIFSLDPDSLIIKPVITNTSLLKFDQSNGDSINFGLSVNFFMNKTLKRIYFWANNVNLNSTGNYPMSLYTYDFNTDYIYKPIDSKMFDYNPVSGGGCVLQNGKILFAGGTISSNYDAHPYCFIANPDNITGVSETALNTDVLNIFPNPVSEVLNFTYNGNAKGQCEVNIIDINGKSLISNQINLNTGINNIYLDATNLAKGIYILQLNSCGKTTYAKFIK